jgi:hypothetical protein
MAQRGYVFRKGGSWFLVSDDSPVDAGRCAASVEAVDYGDRYRCPKDLDDLVADKMFKVRQGFPMPAFFGFDPELRRGSLFALRAALDEAIDAADINIF